MSAGRGALARAARAQAPVFAALGDETRLALVVRLGEGSAQSIAQLTAQSRLTRQAISKHLRVLEGAGLVRGVRQGRENRFELVPAPLAEAQRCLERISAQWDDALARLKEWVER
jgi:DNA-binding transcriptional ArsR family regulator